MVGGPALARGALRARPHRPVRVPPPAPEHRDEVLHLRREIDQVVAAVLAEGVAAGEFEVVDVPATALALLDGDRRRPLVHPDVRRTPEGIEETYGELAVRLVRTTTPR